MSDAPETARAADPAAFCYACGERLAGVCRICGRSFCARHGTIRESLCRKHTWYTIAAWAAAAAAGFGVWWLFFRR